jgi:hypothetical protein
LRVLSGLAASLVAQRSLDCPRAPRVDHLRRFFASSCGLLSARFDVFLRDTRVRRVWLGEKLAAAPPEGHLQRQAVRSMSLFVQRNECNRISGGNQECSAGWSGSRTVNVLPLPSSLPTATDPPWDSAASLTIESPSPLPPSERARASPAR